MTPAAAIIIFFVFLAGSGYTIHRWAPQTWDAGKDKVVSLWQNKTATPQQSEPSTPTVSYPPIQADFSPPNKSALAALNTTPQPATPINTSPAEPQPAAVCEWPNQGLPNYFATSKEGQNCANSSNSPDDECRSNPPTNYNGVISIIEATSSPEIRCCLEDGQCRWQ